MCNLNSAPDRFAHRTMAAVVAAAATTLAAWTAPAHAARYQVAGSVEFAGNGFTVVKDSYNLDTPISISRQVRVDEVNPPTSFHGRAGSGGDGYGLHASTYVGWNYVFTPDYAWPFPGAGYVARSFVGVTYEGVVISGPAGAAPVQTAINFHLSGQQILGTHTPRPGLFSESAASLGLVVSAGTNGASGAFNQRDRNGVLQPIDARGMLANFSASRDLQTPLFTLPVNTPFTMYLQLDTLVSVTADFREGFTVSALSDFGNTFSFATDRPVFNLPAGYSVNSSEAGLVNNTFTSPVPEPRSALLLVAGLGLIAWQSLRSRQA